jgi:hypothetical protein
MFRTDVRSKADMPASCSRFGDDSGICTMAHLSERMATGSIRCSRIVGDVRALVRSARRTFFAEWDRTSEPADRDGLRDVPTMYQHHGKQRGTTVTNGDSPQHR